jgi:hypothetical protein
VKRAVPPDSVSVQLQDFTLSGNVFSGHIYVGLHQSQRPLSSVLTPIQIKNIAFQKVVNVYYSSAADVWPSNAADQGVTASFSASISGTNFETWVFSGTIGSAGIRHFYLRYDVSGTP